MTTLASTDWISALVGPARSEVLGTVGKLPLSTLRKYPPPKRNGLPIGNEGRIANNVRRGRSTQLEASALSAWYRRNMTVAERRLYAGFRANAALDSAEWQAMIGSDAVALWHQQGLLGETLDGRLRARFAVIALDQAICLADSLQDHPLQPGESFCEPTARRSTPNGLFHLTYVGLDSQRMIELLGTLPLGGQTRHLDCGTGAGAILLATAARTSESVGVDINPRAAALAGFNFELNGVHHGSALEADALQLGRSLGEFDLITWNLPFMCVPPEEGVTSLDGYGGWMGIGLCLKFIAVLPSLMTPVGVASIAAVAPILRSGEDVLETELRRLAPTLDLDVDVVDLQRTFYPDAVHRAYHRELGIDDFVCVQLTLRRGSGDFRRQRAPWSRRFIDVMRAGGYRVVRRPMVPTSAEQ